MKADPYGTPSEQCRHQAGWRNSEKGSGRCDGCEHVALDAGGNGKTTAHCNHLDLATKGNAVCDWHEPIPMPKNHGPAMGTPKPNSPEANGWRIECGVYLMSCACCAHLGRADNPNKCALTGFVTAPTSGCNAHQYKQEDDMMSDTPQRPLAGIGKLDVTPDNALPVLKPIAGELIEADADETSTPAEEVILTTEEEERLDAAQRIARREGRREAFAAISKLLTVADLMDLTNIKKTKSYKGFIHTGPDGNRQRITTWPQYCELVEGKSRESIDLEITNLQQFGPEFFDAMRRINVGPGTMRSLRQIPEDERAELEKVAKESSRDEFLDLAETLITRHVDEKQKLTKRAEEAEKNLAASRERVEKLRKTNEALEEAEEQRKLTKPKPDEESEKLRAALGTLALDAKATVMATMRKGIIDLLKYAEATGIDEKPYIAGLLIDIERAVNHLRADFQLPAKLDDDPTPEWLRPGFDPLKAAHGLPQD